MPFSEASLDQRPSRNPYPPIERREERESALRRRVGWMLLVLALLYAGWMMSHGLGTNRQGVPIRFQQEYLGHNGARYAIMARNALRCDTAAVAFAPLVNAEAETEPDPYLHHPPLLHWVVALVFRLFGETEDHARIVPFLFTLLNLVLLFLLAGRVLGNRLTGGIAAIIAALLPMTGYYGAHVDVQGSPLVAGLLGCLLFHRAWIDGGKSLHLAGALCCLITATLFDWPALYLCLLLPLHLRLFRKAEFPTFRAAFRRCLPYLLTGLLLFTALVIWLSLASSAKGTSLIESLLIRTVRPESPVDVGSKVDFVLRGLKDYCIPMVHSLYPWAFWIPVLLGLIARRIAREASPDPALRGWLTLLFALGLIHCIVFPFGLLFHDYWTFLFLPWAAFVMALGVMRTAAAVKALVSDLIAGAAASAVTLTVLFGVILVGLVWAGTVHALDRYDPVHDDLRPFVLGTAIRKTVPVGDAVLTNERCNPPLPGEGDRYSMIRPGYTYYADRVIRGTITSVERFEEVRGRRDDFGWFVFVKLRPGARGPEADEAGLLDHLRNEGSVVTENRWYVFFRLDTP